MFTSPTGRPTHPTHVRSEFGKVAKRAGLGDGWTPNDLRHTAASLMADAGVPIEEVADQLGHRDTRMASLHYRHRIKETVSAGTVLGDVLGARHARQIRGLTVDISGRNGVAGEVTSFGSRRSRVRIPPPRPTNAHLTGISTEQGYWPSAAPGSNVGSNAQSLGRAVSGRLRASPAPRPESWQTALPGGEPACVPTGRKGAARRREHSRGEPRRAGPG